MKQIITTGIFLFLSCAISRADLTELEKKYLAEFANYTGNMGIGFVAEHSFDYAFRQAILRSKDETVQKAFILQKLPREMESVLDALKSGKKMTGKAQYENMTDDDKQALMVRFKEFLTLLQKLDGTKDKRFYSDYQTQFDQVTSSRK